MKGYFVTCDSEIAGWICLKFAYDSDAVSRIKTIPSYLRGWDADAKRWEMDEQAFADAREFLFPAPQWKCFYDHSTAKPGGGRRRDGDGAGRGTNGYMGASASPSSDYDVLWLKPGAPPEVVKAAYSALIRKHHPDMGGDEELAK